MLRRIVSLAVLILPLAALAQSSASCTIEQGVFNAGGNPSPVLTSTRFKMTLDAIGDGIAAASLSSASYVSRAGLVPGYPSPREIFWSFRPARATR